MLKFLVAKDLLNEVPVRKLVDEAPGGFNKLPASSRLISGREYLSRLGALSVEAMEFRQVNVEIDGAQARRTSHAHLSYFSDGTGVVIVQHPVTGEPLHYAFGCAHRYREVTPRERKLLHVQVHSSSDHWDLCEQCGDTKYRETSG